MNVNCIGVMREEEIINFFKRKDHMYTVRLREQLNIYIEEQTEKKISKEEIIKNCAKKFALQQNDISEYIRRLRIYQVMDEMTQKLFEGICF